MNFQLETRGQFEACSDHEVASKQLQLHHYFLTPFPGLVGLWHVTKLARWWPLSIAMRGPGGHLRLACNPYRRGLRCVTVRQQVALSIIVRVEHQLKTIHWIFFGQWELQTFVASLHRLVQCVV